jgi:hypothetical protein
MNTENTLSAKIAEHIANVLVGPQPELRLSDKIAEQVYDTLTRQRFVDWYNGGRFDAHINCPGGDGTPTKEDILEDIKRLFQLE